MKLVVLNVVGTRVKSRTCRYSVRLIQTLCMSWSTMHSTSSVLRVLNESRNLQSRTVSALLKISTSRLMLSSQDLYLPVIHCPSVTDIFNLRQPAINGTALEVSNRVLGLLSVEVQEL